VIVRALTINVVSPVPLGMFAAECACSDRDGANGDVFFTVDAYHDPSQIGEFH